MIIKPSPSPYSIEDRERARRMYRTTLELAMQSKQAAERGTLLSPESEEIVAALTRTSDMSHRATTLFSISDDIRAQHLKKLLVLAPTEFAAFCEYVNPDEPPESNWHQYLTSTLQDIEYNPERHRIILNCPPGHAKPLHVDTPVLMGNGTWKRLGDIKVGDEVVSHKGKIRKVTEVHEQGVLPILRIVTTAGRVINSAPDHSFWVDPGKGYIKRGTAGWRKAEDLRPGDKLRLVHRPSQSRSAPIGGGGDVVDARFAAVVQAQGAMSWMTGRNQDSAYRSFYLYAPTEALANEFDGLMTAIGVKHSCKPLKNNIGYVLRMTTADANDLSAKFRLDDRRENRRVPDFIMSGTAREKKEYLSKFFSLSGEAPMRYGGHWLYVYSHSEDFLADIQKLLGWFDIDAVLDNWTRKRDKRARLIVRDGALTTFLASIPYDGKYVDRLKNEAESAKAETDEIRLVELANPGECRCLTVDTEHTFIANGVVVHNSTYASRLFVAWRLGRDPNQRIIGGGHSQTFVENEMSKRIRELIRSPAYKEVFPAVVISSHTSGAGQWNLVGTKGQYVARGVGQAVHGFRATFIIVDDPYPSIEAAESATQRGKVSTWFTTDIGSRVLPGGKVFVIMTRFHEEDLTGYLMDMNDKLPIHDRWELIEAPAICYDEERDIMSRRLGEVLWDFYDLSYFRTKKAELTYSRFALIYQQLADAASAGSVTGHFKYYTYLPHQTPTVIRDAVDKGQVDDNGKPKIDRKDFFRRVVLSVDTASKATERSDYTAIQVWGETHDRKYYLFDSKRMKVEFNDMVSEIEKLARRYEVDAILVEDKGSGTSYIQHRGETDFQRRQAPAPIVAIQVPSNQGKAFRFDEVCPMIEAGDVFLPENAGWVDAYIRELGQFPEGAHDDMVDATSQALRYFKSTRTRFGSRKVTSMG